MSIQNTSVSDVAVDDDTTEIATTVSLKPSAQRGGDETVARHDRESIRRTEVRLSRPVTQRRSAEQTTVRTRVPTEQRRTRRRRVDSLYSPERPPPLEAPSGVAEVMGWELAARLWRDHLPEQLLGVDCAACGSSWPCDAWELANGILTDCHHGANPEE
ncbi:hypothetical protein [Haloglycomyces albus]|uniref:hypothetical protein n=1 Tax=Haloglycomyces albus TaxID=526067 RepID=UPI0012EB922D|nr:hypothetical protein [Haloglycomyces albus]